MPRKTRREISKDTYDDIISMSCSNQYTIKQIAETLRICTKTVSNVLKRYEAGIFYLSAGQKRKETCNQRNASFSAEEQTLFNAVACDNSLTQKEMSQKVFETCHVQLAQPTISKKLTKIGITRKRLSKVPFERNSEERLNARSIYATEISRMSDKNLIFLDETGFNEHTVRKYGYSPRNTKAYINVPANKNINRSLMVAINTNGIVAYDYRLSGYKSEHFIIFINTKLAKHFRRNPQHVLIMDNAPFHKSRQVINALINNRIPYKFTVPYSPELNPVEEFFAMLKSKFHSVRHLEPNLTIEESITRVCSSENHYNEQCNGFYRNMRSWIEKARRMEPFI